MGNALNQRIAPDEFRTAEIQTRQINGYSVIMKHNDKNLTDCMKNVIKRTLVK